MNYGEWLITFYCISSLLIIKKNIQNPDLLQSMPIAVKAKTQSTEYLALKMEYEYVSTDLINWFLRTENLIGNKLEVF